MVKRADMLGNTLAQRSELEATQMIKGLCFRRYNTSLAVSRDGRVIGRNRQVLKPRDNGKGYHIVSYKGDRKWWSNKYVHRIVAELYVPNPMGLKYVNHIDGDKSNNHADNLEWCTAKRNTEHAIQTGLLTNLPKKGEHGFQKANTSTS